MGPGLRFAGGSRGTEEGDGGRSGVWAATGAMQTSIEPETLRSRMRDNNLLPLFRNVATFFFC